MVSVVTGNCCSYRCFASKTVIVVSLLVSVVVVFFLVVSGVCVGGVGVFVVAD